MTRRPTFPAAKALHGRRKSAPSALGWLMGGALALALGAALGLTLRADPAREAPPPAPVAATPAPSVAVAPAPSPSPSQAAFMAQLAAYGSARAARAGFARLRDAHPEALASFAAPDLESVAADGKTLVRLRVGPFATRAQAAALCEALRLRNQGCLVRGR